MQYVPDRTSTQVPIIEGYLPRFHYGAAKFDPTDTRESQFYRGSSRCMTHTHDNIHLARDSAQNVRANYNNPSDTIGYVRRFLR